MRSSAAILVSLWWLLAAPARAGEPADGGTQVTIQVGDGGDTDVEVHQGALKVRAGGEETRVTAGQGVHVKRGHRAKKISLLPAPGSLVPADGAHVNTVAVVLSWAKVAGAHRYQLRIRRTAGETWSREIASEVPTARLELAPGIYRWSVHAVDPSGLDGRTAAPHQLTVDVTPPKLKAGKPKWK